MESTEKQGSSTGKKSTQTPPLANVKESVEKRLDPARTKNENASGLKTLADILSLIQEDVRRYNLALAKLGQNGGAGIVFASGGIIIALANPVDHVLSTGNGHIVLDGVPVTGWTLADEDTGKEMKED